MTAEQLIKAKLIKDIKQNIMQLRDVSNAKGIGEYGNSIADILAGLDFKIENIEEEMNPGSAFISDADIARPLR